MRTSGHEAIELASLIGLELDDWQKYILINALGEREDGRWSAATSGVVIARQNGKNDQSLTTDILTTEGWTTFAEIEPGQYVYGSDGKPTRVTGISEKFFDSECYEVEFTDGSKHVVGSGHLWHVRKGGKWKTSTTQEIALSRWGLRRLSNGRMEYLYRVRCDAVVDAPEADLPIDPYIFGYWLGDGSSGDSAITAGYEDSDYVRGAIAGAGYRLGAEGHHSTGRAVTIRFNINEKMRDGFISRCKRLGVWNEKHIPDVYLTASIEQRIALLRGLMDSDGSIANTNRSSQVEYSSSFLALADTFHQLARGLGIRVTPKWRETEGKDNCRFLWTPTFNPFRMPRKSSKYREPVSSRHQLMSITGIRHVDSVPTRCISVAAEDGIYLVGRRFTPTHNSILEARELFGLFVLGERLIVHTAHLQSTASEQFRRLRDRIKSVPEFESRVAKFNMSNGKESIELVNGQRILFATRTASVARGLTIDVIIYDEAMHLSEDERSSITPTMSALSMTGNTQTWYTGSAVDKENPKHDGVPFAQIREAGINKSERVAYFEWSAPGDDPDAVTPEERADMGLIAQANPGLGIRISPEWVEHERMVELGPRGFAVERMGIGDWPDPDELNNRAIPPEAWMACVDPESEAKEPVCFALDVTPDRSAAAIAVAGWRKDGKSHVGVVRHQRGTEWVLEEIEALMARYKPVGIIVDSRGQGNAFVPDLLKAKIEPTITNAREYTQACGIFYDSVVYKTLTHRGMPELNEAVFNALKRDVSSGDAWAWDKRNSSADISPLVACTLALWGNQTLAKKAKARVIDMADVLRKAQEGEK